MSWAEYYVKKVGKHESGYPGYHELKVLENTPFIDVIERHAKPNGELLQIGLGPGSYSIELTKRGYKVLGIDNEAGIIGLSNRHASFLGLGPLRSVQADMFNLPFSKKSIPLSYSLGVLEHFEDDEIRAALQEALRVSQTHIFVVPTDVSACPEAREELSLTQFHGDERYLSAEYWEQLIEDMGLTTLEKFGYWMPEMRSKVDHPEDPTGAFGQGLYAGFVLVNE